MKKPDFYVYPAIFTYEAGHEISVTFPDFLGCATSGEHESEALNMAKDALGGRLWCMETDGEEIPMPTPLREVKVEENEQAVLVEVFMPSIRMAQANKAVNRTVTLPAWLNAVALEKNVNFSQVLQAALIQQLNVDKTRIG